MRRAEQVSKDRDPASQLVLRASLEARLLKEARLLFAVFVLFFSSFLVAAPSEAAAEGLPEIDAVVARALKRGDCPGAVVLVVRDGAVVWRKAYGLRSQQPKEAPMTVDTVFDLASLTKPVATATSIWVLIEQGKLRLSDRVADHLPGFGQNGKETITVEQLMLHTSGLIPDNSLVDYQGTRRAMLDRVFALSLRSKPAERFAYSDVGYIVLGELVERVSGQSLDAFAREHIFSPLGMNATGFRPSDSLRERAAPTEQREGRWLAGEVHDPRAARLGGVAGHAGLFSTADDLALYVRMLLGMGTFNGRRVLKEETVRLMTQPRPVPGGLRSCGWDVKTGYSSNRGDRFRPGEGFGHTGFTGTSLWVDPESKTGVILLTNRVHPNGKGNVMRLCEIATAAAPEGLASGGRQPPVYKVLASGVLTGLDVLVREKFARLQGRRVGLVTNHTGRDREGRSTVDLLHQAKGVTVAALFSPEHGLRGAIDEKVFDGKDEATGLPVYSLYGQRQKPTAETLKGLDTLVYDIQDAGCRFYTYITTLGLVLEAASEHGLRVVVLDRPNLLGGLAVEGPMLDPGRESFTAYHALPIRYGLTIGELAQLFRAERRLTCPLEVVRLEGWHRGDLYDQTGLEWVSPSPNLRSLPAALLYPGVGLLETTNVSVGRGTERPFEWVGAPWIDGRRWATALREEGLPGVRFVPVRMTPTASTHKGQSCGGVQLIVDDWTRFRPLPTGLAMAVTLRRLYPKEWQVNRFNVLLGHQRTLEQVKAGADWRTIIREWDADLAAFAERRRACLIYQETREK